MNELKVVVIVGSSSEDGDAVQVAKRVSKVNNWDFITLADYEISYYDYNHSNSEDDFLVLIERLIITYDIFVFVSPVYWYTVSAQVKTFLDRFSDLLTIKKELGRRLRGKSMAAIAVSIGSDPGDQYWFPFKKTAAYLGMHYLAESYIYEKESTEALQSFASKILNAPS